MNRPRILSVLAVPLLLGAWSASAQDGGWSQYRPTSTLFTLGYQIAQPIGSLHGYIDSTSFRGIMFDWRSKVYKDVTAGLRFSWNRFSETYPSLTQTTSTGGTLQGPVFRFMDQLALEFIAHYYIGAGSDIITPYVGFGFGGVWSNSYQQTADIGASQNGFYFIVSPEIGTVIWFARGATNVGLNLAVTYHFTTISFRNVSDAQSFAETIGLSFAY